MITYCTTSQHFWVLFLVGATPTVPGAYALGPNLNDAYCIGRDEPEFELCLHDRIRTE